MVCLEYCKGSLLRYVQTIIQNACTFVCVTYLSLLIVIEFSLDQEMGRGKNK